MQKMRIPHIWSVGLLLIFMINISIFPQSRSVLHSDRQNQDDMLNPPEEQNQRFQYNTINHQFMQGKEMSPWSPPSLSGIGSTLPVLEYADIIEANQQITLTYDSGTSSYSTDTASLILPSPWEGTRLYTFVDNIDEDRVWVNNTDFSTTVNPWTGSDYDAPSYTNTFVEERVTNPPGQSGDPAIHLRMNAAGNTRFDAGDACWFEETVNITRGTAVYAWLEFDYYAADGAGGTGEAPWGHTQLYIQIEGIDVWVTAFDDIPLEQTWYHLPPTSIDPSVFNTPNSQVDIRIGIRSVLSMSYTTVNYNEAYFDDVEIHLKALARPSDLGLTMNGYAVEDSNITHPDGYTLNVGSYSSGAVSDLQDSDNSDLVIYSSSNQIDLYTYYDLDTNGITEAEVTILELWIESAFSTDITDGDLLVYNFSAGAWEKIHDGYTPNVVDEDWSWITTNPAQYIHDTEHYIRFRINGTHSSSFSLGIDYVHFAMTTTTGNAAFGVGMYVQDKGTPWTSVDSPIAADFTFNYGTNPPDLDVTVTLDCDQRFYAYRNTPDTLYEMNTGSLGTNYWVGNGTDVTWDFYVYISVPSGYTATEFTISSIPTDWSISWVSEPQTPTVNNVGKTYLSVGVLTIPIPPISPAPDGYWHIKATSPNYGQDVITEKQNGGPWAPATLFHPNEYIRANGTINNGTSEIPVIMNPNYAMLKWIDPSGVIWYENSTVEDPNSDGIVTVEPPSPPNPFNGTTTKAGEWNVLLSWENGTEVAYYAESFDLFHSSELIALNSPLSAYLGDIATIRVRFNDTDNGNFIDDTYNATVWNTGSAFFPRQNFTLNPDLNCWQADFDTGPPVTAGQYFLTINGNASYYEDPLSIQFTLDVTDPMTRLTVIDPGPTVQINVNEEQDIVLHYEDQNGVPIDGATIQWDNPPQVTIVNNQILAVGGGTGNYTGTLKATAGGVWTTAFNASGVPGFSVGYTFFTIATGVTPARLRITNSTGHNVTQAVIGVGDEYNLTLNYTRAEAPIYGINATSWTIDVDPVVGLNIPDPTPTGTPGEYNVTLAPQSAGTYTIIFTAHNDSYTDGVAPFTLLMGDISATLTVSPKSKEILAEKTTSFTLWYKMSNGTGIPDASITYSISPSASLNIKDKDGGQYTASGTFGTPNTYTIRFTASKTNYTDGRVTAVLNVILRPTNLEITNPSAVEIIAQETYPLKVKYIDTSNDQGLGGGSVSVAVTPTTGMTYEPGVHLGSGIYQIVLHGDSIGTYTVTVSLSRQPYRRASVNFFLTVKPIPTILNILELKGTNLTTSLAQPINETFQVTLNFGRDENASRPVENATLTLLGIEEWQVVNYLGNGTYIIEVNTGDTLGIYPILALASKSNYETGRAAFELQVRPFSTELFLWEREEAFATVPVGETLEFDVYYNNTDRGEPISEAELVISGLPLTNERSITWEQIGDIYRVSIGTGILPETIPFTLTITGRHPPQFDPASITFELTIITIPFRAQNQPPAVPGAEPTLSQSISIVEDQKANVTIQLWDTYHDSPIEEAEVIWTLYVPETQEQGQGTAKAAGGTPTINSVTIQSLEGEQASGKFEYVGNGTYVAFVSAKGLDPGTYRVEVIASKELYGEQTFTMDYVVTPKPGTPPTYFLGLASIIIGSIGGFYSWYFYFRWPPQVRYIRKAIKRVEAGSQIEEGRFPSKEEHRQAITEEQLRLPRQLTE